jgi:outer membrane protein assembly factor BamB
VKSTPSTVIALSFGLVFWLTQPVAFADPDPAAADEEALHAAGASAEGPALVEFFRKRTLPDSDRPHVAELVRKLGDETSAVRDAAAADLIALGPAVKASLREALRDPDVEIACRSRECLVAIERESRVTFLEAAMRTLARKRPPGGVEALLGYAPHIEGGEAFDAACQALSELGARGDKADAALLRALSDKQACRRAAAGEALARAPSADVRKSARKLLGDADAAVRQRVALALLDMRDKEAAPALIDLLAETPRERGWMVEDALGRLAGDRPPAAPLGDDAEARGKRREAWADWWKEHGPGLDLSKIDLASRALGYTLIAELDADNKCGRILELDAKGQTRWQFTAGRIVLDAQAVGPDRVLVAEYTSRTVSEYTTKGEEKWQYTAKGLVLGGRRLSDGQTLVVCRNQIVQVDKDGKETLTIDRPNDVAAAAKFRDGRFAVLSTSGNVLVLDAEGKEQKAMALNAPVLAVGSNIEALPNGRVLVPLYSSNKVIELDPDGKTAWEAAVTQPNSATRLPNGHTLVASRTTQMVTEFDRAGKEVRSFKTEGRPYRVTQR